MVLSRGHLHVYPRRGEVPRDLDVRYGHRGESGIGALPLQQPGKVPADLAFDPGGPIELSRHQTERSNSTRLNTSILSPSCTSS